MTTAAPDRADFFPDQPIDSEIEPLIRAMNDDEHVRTFGSCWGHEHSEAYIDFAVCGMDGLRRFVATLNRVADECEDAFLDVTLNWSEDVATACDFEMWPDWIMLSLTIEGADGFPPSIKLLHDIATSYTLAAGCRAHLSGTSN